MKICVCASVFGNLHYFNSKANPNEKQTLSLKNEKTDIDFYLFTNLTHYVLQSTIHKHWKVITVSDNDDFMKENNFRKDNNVNQVQKSRYFKFQLHKYFNGQYDFIIYLDHHIHLDPNANWEDIASSVINEATENNLALVQVKHKDGTDSIKRESNLIALCNVDTRINVNKALDYLNTINNSVDLEEKIIYRENWIFGYCPNHKETVEHFDIFWSHYLNEGYATKRDQPLWNFLFLARNKTSKMMNLLKFTTNKETYVNRCNMDMGTRNQKGIIGEYLFSYGKDSVNRTSLINHIICKYKFKKYLEIGIRNPYDNFNLIKSNDKVGVDPKPLVKINSIKLQTSDEFFESINSDVKFDVIFVDGLHLEYQCTRDISNSLHHLNDNGFILVSDCNPPTEHHQIETYDGKSAWNGTVWKSIAKLRMSNSHLRINTIDTDTGVGIITKEQNINNTIKKEENLDWNYLQNNRNEILNLINVHDFLSIY